VGPYNTQKYAEKESKEDVNKPGIKICLGHEKDPVTGGAETYRNEEKKQVVDIKFNFLPEDRSAACFFILYGTGYFQGYVFQPRCLKIYSLA